MVGPLSILKYNPANDVLRFLVFILFPVLILLMVYFLSTGKFKNVCFSESSKKFHSHFYFNPSNDSHPTSRKKAALLLALFSIIIALNIPTYQSNELKFVDTFHEGESLGPSISYLNGEVPYKDFILFKGIYHDPLRSVIAFKLFGRSIGSVRALESIVKLVMFVLLAVFLVEIYPNHIYSFVTFTILAFFIIFEQFFRFLGGCYSRLLIIPPRDITTLSFLVTIPILHNFIRGREDNPNKFFITNFFFSFIPLASFAYSVDRGFYLFASYLVLSPILYFVFFRKSKLHKYYLVSSLSGLLSAVSLLGFFLRGHFYPFFEFLFLILPKYKELVDGLVFQISDYRLFMICVLIALNVYWLTFKFIQELHLSDRKFNVAIKKFTEKFLVEFSLLLLSVFFFRSALGRSSWIHIAYCALPLYILSINFFVLPPLHNFVARYNLQKTFRKIVILSVSGVILMAGYSFYGIYGNAMITQNFPLNKSDDEFISFDYKDTISFLKNNLGENEDFFTLTSEGIWYYFLDKPCPTRFPVVWLAGPDFYHEEIIESLKKKNVKFILYNSHYALKVDGITIEEKMPAVFEYVRKEYTPFKRLHHYNDIWIKKTYLK